MADSVQIKGVPDEALRLFTRIDNITTAPAEIYNALGIQEEDRAEFTLTPADPITKDGLREVEAGISDGFEIIEAESGVDKNRLSIIAEKSQEVQSCIGSDGAISQDAYDKIEFTEEQLIVFDEVQKANQVVASRKASFYRCAIADSDTRELLAQGTSVSNYKENINGELVVSKKSASEIIATMPDVLAEWLYKETIKHSSLTDSEYLGV